MILTVFDMLQCPAVSKKQSGVCKAACALDKTDGRRRHRGDSNNEVISAAFTRTVNIYCVKDLKDDMETFGREIETIQKKKEEANGNLRTERCN